MRSDVFDARAGLNQKTGNDATVPGPKHNAKDHMTHNNRTLEKEPQPVDFQCPQRVNPAPPRPQASFSLLLAAGVALLAGMGAASAADVTLSGGDGFNSSSFNSAGHWNNSAAPSAGNAYHTGNNLLRTPPDGGTYTFGGDSLSIDAGANGHLLGKATGATGVITVNNLILNGGFFDQANNNGDSVTLTVAGNITVNAASFLGAIGGTGNASGAFEILNIAAPISGSAALQVSGPQINTGQDTGVVKLNAANPFSGTITVSNGNSGVIASSVDRILQLNNLNALSSATLNLDSVQASPVSFVSDINTAPFNVGALTGKASQALVDTVGSAMTLSVGGNNASTAYWGVLSGIGSLVKTGSGTLTLSNANTYTGNTVISAGTLKLSSGGSLASGNINIASGATLDVTTQTNPVLAANQNLLGTGAVNGSLTTAAMSKIYAGADGAAGSLTFNNNLTNVSGSAFNLDVSTSAGSGNDHIIVTGALVLNNTTLNIQTLGGGANLDASADYVLITAASISGTPNSAVSWVGAQPANAGNFTVIANSTQVKLHYSAGTPLTATGSANPTAVTRNQATLLTITVTPGTFPTSTGISAKADLTPIGDSAAQAFYDDGTHGDVTAGDGTYSFSAAVAPATLAGSLIINGTVTDAQTRIATPTIALSVVTGNLTWNGGGADDNWSSSPNWAGGVAPGYAGDTLTFAGTTRLTPNMEANYSVTDVTFDSSAGSFTIGSTTGSALTLTGVGVVNSSANEQTLNVPITTAAPEIFNASAGNLTLGQAITNNGNLVTISGGAITKINGAISSTGGLSKEDGGTLILNGTNTYTGDTTVNGGTLQLAGAGLLGGGNYSANITNYGVFEYSSSATQTLSGVISFNGVLVDGSSTLILAGANTFYGDATINSGVLQIAGAGSLQGGTYAGNLTDNGIFQYSSSAAQTLTGVISGSGGLVKDGSGTLTLSGANTYIGSTVVTAGTLVYNPATVSYSTINSLSVSNATVTINVNSGTPLPVGSLILDNNSILNLNYDFSGGNPTAAAVGITTSLLVPGTNITINLSGEGAAVGQVHLITYVGAPLPNLANFKLGILPPGVTASLVNNTGNQSIDLNVTAEVPATWIPLTTTDSLGTSSFDSGTSWLGNNAPSAGNGYYTKTFSVRSPADANPYTFAGDVLSVDVGGRFIMKGTGGQVMTVNNLVINGGLVDFAVNDADNLTETLAGNITLQPGLTSFMGALGNSGFETLFVTASIGGAGNLQVDGNGGQDRGNLVLAGANTYTGTTTVSRGILLVNGSVANTPITVTANTSLGGTGTIGGTVDVLAGGTLMPGIPIRGALTAAIGTLTAGNTTVAGTARMRIDRSATINSDRLVAPSVVVHSGATLTVVNLGSTNLAAGDTFTLFSTPITGSFSTVTLPALPGTNVYWTNNLAVNGTIAVAAIVSVNTNSPYVTNSFSGGNLTLAWPADHTGWTLQAQTNSAGVGLGTNWVDVPGSTLTNAVLIPINSTNAAVFYRLKL